MNKFFIAAIAAFTLLASCSNEETGVTPQNGDDTYAGLVITLPAQTRAEDAAAASDVEKAINTIGVYIVDQATNELHSKVLTSSEFQLDGAVYKAKAAVKTTLGTKTVYVVANPTAALTTKLSQLGANAFTNILTMTDADFWTSNDMVMTGQSTATLTDAKNATEALQDGNLVAVTIDRVLAKVVVKFKTATPTVTGGGTSSNQQFAPITKALGAYLMPRTGTDKPAYYTVPTAAETDATHTYFSNFSALQADPSEYVGVNAYNVATKDAVGFYCHEHYASKLLTGNTTAARIKAKFTPSEVVTSYDKTTGVRGTGTMSGNGDFYVLKTEGTYWNQTAYNNATTATDPAYKIDASLFSDKYVGGIGYYKIFVQDAASVKAVKRNLYYELTITEIRGPGSPTEDDDDDKDIEIQDDTYVAVSVSVKHWDLQQSEHIIQ